MPTNQIAAQNVEALRAQLAQAKAAELALAHEASNLPNRIKEAAREVVREKAQKARMGGALIAVGAEAELAELEQRSKNIEFELWAAKLHRGELAAKLGEIEEKAAHLEVPAAEGKHRAAEAAVVDAQAAEAAAYTAKLRAYGRVDIARKAKTDAREEITRLEDAYPGA